MLKQMIRMSTAMTLALLMSLTVAGPASAQDDTYPPEEPSGDIAGGLNDGNVDDETGGGAAGDDGVDDETGDGAAGDDGVDDETGDEAAGDVGSGDQTDGDQAGGDVAGDDAAGDDDLAFTGSEFSLPLAIGAALIGGGALMYLAAAKRRNVTV